MSVLDTRSTRASDEAQPRGSGRWGRPGPIDLIAVAVIAVVLGRGWLLGLIDSPRALTLVTVFVSIMVQALPFLVLGTVLSAAITAFVPRGSSSGRCRATRSRRCRWPGAAGCAAARAASAGRCRWRAR